MAASEGVDLEWCIVEMIQMKNGKLSKFTRPFSAKIQLQAKKCVEQVMAFAGRSKVEAWHSDDRKNPFGVAISAKPEPKTDVVFKIGSKVYTTSVKMAGPVQLASGQGSSTAELFESAVKHIPNSNKSKVLESIIKELKTMPTRLLSESNLPRIKQEASPKVIEEFIKNGKIIKDKKYEDWLANNKPKLMESLLKFIDGDPDFTTALLYEALTGELSLKQYRGAVADSILSPKGFYEIDGQYVNSIINKVKFDVRGKSRSGITGLAFRIDLNG
ncbi:MAG: hypothetical protein EBU90_27680 [Proteobacteria bacterium]|nr:hypothetical protein [Pseudomonadota bacterium]